jgi:methoxymalonate biosynthesis protein
VSPGTRSGAVKCVVWDLDGTVLSGVAVETPVGQPLRTRPEALRAMAVLEERGIANSVASRTDPSVAEAVGRHPALADRFVAAQFGWGHKSEAISRIAAELDIAVSDVAFVDDSPFERAEVAAVLPEVLVLAPDELYASLDTPALRPSVVTEDAGRRVERYRTERQRREAERDFAGTREQFLASCDIRLAVGVARPAHADRLAEMAERTHRFNTSGARWPASAVRAMIDDPRWYVPVAWLSDRFGDHGMIAAAFVERGPVAAGAAEAVAFVERGPVAAGAADAAGREWRMRLLMVSCRVAGRDVPIAMLRHIARSAAAGGAGGLLADLRPDRANVELRMLLRRAGFRARLSSGDSGRLLLARSLADLPPPAPPWLRVEESGD